mgnify:CR=1 FL=1|tara:strand:- start:65 stop:778 length:714 start_codon:yes stop_codon:yes gene_type:complete
MADLANVSEWSAARLPLILQGVESALDEWAKTTGADAADSVTKAAAMGDELSGRFEVAAATSRDALFVAVSPENVSALAQATAQEMVAVGVDIKRKVAGELRPVALGLRRPFEAIEAVGRIVPAVRRRMPDGRLATVGPTQRAEVIVRTEINRAFSYASQRRMEKVAANLPRKPRKRWVTSIDGRERGSHRAADGQERDFDEPFDVNGAQLMFPGDPAGPPGEVINCRCTSIPVVEA